MPRHSPYAIPHQRDTELCQPVNADISLILAGPGGLAARSRFCTRVVLNTDICARSGLNTNATSAHLHAREFVRPPVLLREIGVGGDVVAEGLSRWVENDGAPQMMRNIPEMADRRTQRPTSISAFGRFLLLTASRKSLSCEPPVSLTVCTTSPSLLYAVQRDPPITSAPSVPWNAAPYCAPSSGRVLLKLRSSQTSMKSP